MAEPAAEFEPQPETAESDEAGKAIMIKLLVVGERDVGKTALLRRYVNNSYRPERGRIQMGADFCLKTIHRTDGSVIRLQFWDIPSIERFTNMTQVRTRLMLSPSIPSSSVHELTQSRLA